MQKKIFHMATSLALVALMGGPALAQSPVEAPEEVTVEGVFEEEPVIAEEAMTAQAQEGAPIAESETTQSPVIVPFGLRIPTGKYKVHTDNVWVREVPGTGGRRVTILNYGDYFYVLDQQTVTKDGIVWAYGYTTVMGYTVQGWIWANSFN